MKIGLVRRNLRLVIVVGAGLLSGCDILEHAERQREVAQYERDYAEVERRAAQEEASARSLWAAGQREEAERTITSAVGSRYRPPDRNPWMGPDYAGDTASRRELRGFFRFHLGDYTGTIEDYDRAQVLRGSECAFLERISAKAYSGRLGEALDEVEKSIRWANERKDPTTWQLGIRAEIRLLTFDLAGALADLDGAWRTDERKTWVLLWRGVTKLLLGRRSEAVGDFELHAAKVPESACCDALWLVAAGESTDRLGPWLDQEGWYGTLARALAGRTGTETLLAHPAKAADDRARARMLCEAQCFLGVLAERVGDPKRAKEHYLACVATNLASEVDYSWAKNRLRALAEGVTAPVNLEVH